MIQKGESKASVTTPLPKTNCIGILYDFVHVLVFFGVTLRDGEDGHEKGIKWG